MPWHFTGQFFLLPRVKFFSSLSSPLTCYSSKTLYKYIWLVIVFVISLFDLSEMPPVKAKNWEKYGAFLNSFHPKVKRLIRRLHRINDKMGRNKVSVLSNQICFTGKNASYMYIYIYIYMLKATPQETIALWRFTLHLKTHSSKTNQICGTLLEKQGRTHKWRFSMDSYTWTFLCCPTSKNLSTSALCWHKM